LEKSQVTSLIEEWLSTFLDEEYFIVSITHKRGMMNDLLFVDIDGDKGLTIDKCTEVSRFLSGKLEEADIIKNSYRLEVGSPGLDKPLKLLRQYQKNVGRRIKVLLEDGQKRKGVLVGVSADCITINHELVEQTANLKQKAKVVAIEEQSINFKDIKQAKVLV